MKPSVRLTTWALLCLLAAPLLYGVCWLDTAMAGQSWSDADPFPYEQADSVRFGLSGLRYLYRGDLLTGPHIGYPLVLGVLALNTLLLWLARGWGERARRMLRVSGLALLLTLGLGGPLLKVAQWSHNRLLEQSDVLAVRAMPAFFHETGVWNAKPLGVALSTKP
ncbi:hypothetical protein [Deinococcus fonticola]|uniref:hypothetical protein n=1 Tax=Deinococcus fonticola TaxID=2528713 RepID=UPI001074D5A3|nr:hypothetical protein [Deinococcus fonticola]